MKQSKKKNYLQQTFPFGCSLSLCSFSLFLGFSFLPKVFSIQFFFGHRSHCRTVHSVSFWLFVFRFYSLDRAFCVCVCVCASFSSLSNGSHSTGPFKETTPRLRYPKTKHTFSTFRRIHASLFVSQLLIFLFRSVFHLRSTSYIATGPNCFLNNTIAQAQCTYMIIYVTFWYRFLLLACTYLFVCRAFS